VPVKDRVNQFLSRVTGYHLAHGRPGSLPTPAQARMDALLARVERAEERRRQAERRAAKAQRRLKELEAKMRRRSSLQPARPLADSEDD
jgi:hypothetical protein